MEFRWTISLYDKHTRQGSSTLKIFTLYSVHVLAVVIGISSSIPIKFYNTHAWHLNDLINSIVIETKRL